MKPGITVNQVPIQWTEEEDRFTFFGVEGIIFWKDPSLLSLLDPLRQELGEEIYALLIAHEVSRGTYEDYHTMVESLGASFEEGFANWGQAVSGAGWGRFRLESLDWEAKRARVRVERPWELQLFSAQTPRYAVPFLDGKLSGIFSWAFRTNCRAEIAAVETRDDDSPSVVLDIAPSATTLQDELHQLQAQRGLSPQAQLRAANRHLREHLARFFDVVEAVGEFVWEVDRDLTLTFATDSLGGLLGFATGELIGRDFREVMTAEGQEAFGRFLDDPEGGEGRHLITCMRTRDGESLRISLSLQPTTDLHGEVNGFRGAGRNVTQEFRAQQELEEHRRHLSELVSQRTQDLERAEDRNRLLLDSIGEGIYGLDTAGRITFINPAAARLLDYREEEILGENAHALIHGRGADDNAADSPVLAALREGEAQRVGEDTFWRADGTPLPVSYYCAPVEEDGAVTGAVITFQDITQQKQAAREREQLLEILEASPDFIGMADRKGSLLYRNPAAARILGQRGSGITAETTQAGQPLWSIRRIRDEGLPEASAHGFWEGETAFLDPDGNEIPFSQIIIAHYGETGAVERFATIARDISTQKERESRLRLSAAVLDSIAEGIMVTEADGTIVETNPAFTAITGYSREEVMGRTPELLTEGESGVEDFREQWRILREKGFWQGEVRNRRRNGTRFQAWQTISTVHDDHGNPAFYVSVLTDISELKQTEEVLVAQAYYDDLTGLPNRRYLTERLESAFQRARSEGTLVAVLLMDLDRFQAVNDSFGHAAGDWLLQRSAGRFHRQLPASTTLARLGGDEFAFVVEGLTSTTEATATAQALLAALHEPVYMGERSFQLSSSMGISVFPEDGTDSGTLLRNADTALHLAKQSGRGQYRIYTAELTEATREQLQLEGALRRALQEEQLQLYFQPLLDLRSGRIIGAEALARWQDSHFGWVSPSRFIPLAEETGLILPLGDWVLRSAAGWARYWREAGLEPGRISVNLSPHQLERADLPETLGAILAENDLPGCALELEVTENTFLHDAERAARVLGELRELGVGMAVDDFGTGYSSLAYLKRLPVDRLKIDGSFVSDIPHDNNDTAITRAIVALGESLGLTTLAEGIETREQMEFLHRTGALEGQGFLYSEPLPPEEFARLLAADRTSSRPPPST